MGFVAEKMTNNNYCLSQRIIVNGQLIIRESTEKEGLEKNNMLPVK